MTNISGMESDSRGWPSTEGPKEKVIPEQPPFSLYMTGAIPSPLSFQLRLMLIPGTARMYFLGPLRYDVLKSFSSQWHLYRLVQHIASFFSFSLTFFSFHVFIVPILTIRLVCKLQEEKSGNKSLPLGHLPNALRTHPIKCLTVINSGGCQGCT